MSQKRVLSLLRKRSPFISAGKFREVRCFFFCPRQPAQVSLKWKMYFMLLCLKGIRGPCQTAVSDGNMVATHFCGSSPPPNAVISLLISIRHTRSPISLWDWGMKRKHTLKRIFQVRVIDVLPLGQRDVLRPASPKKWRCICLLMLLCQSRYIQDEWVSK